MKKVKFTTMLPENYIIKLKVEAAKNKTSASKILEKLLDDHFKIKHKDA
jgi:hypothetical protein